MDYDYYVEKQEEEDFDQEQEIRECELQAEIDREKQGIKEIGYETYVLEKEFDRNLYEEVKIEEERKKSLNPKK